MRKFPHETTAYYEKLESQNQNLSDQLSDEIEDFQQDVFDEVERNQQEIEERRLNKALCENDENASEHSSDKYIFKPLHATDQYYYEFWYEELLK